MKTYGLRVLEDLCGGTDGCIASVLPSHELRPDGLYVKGAPRLVAAKEAGAMLAGAEHETWRWQPTGDGPALPIPFTVFHLAAFCLKGQGLSLWERLDEKEFDSKFIRQLIAEATRWVNEARERFKLAGVQERRTLIEEGKRIEVVIYKAVADDQEVDANEQADAKEKRRQVQRRQVQENDDQAQAAADWLLSQVNAALGAEQSEGQLPVVSAPALEEPSLTTSEIASVFDGIAAEYSASKWREKLGDTNNHKWVVPALVKRGMAPAPSTWDPLKLAEILLRDRDVPEVALTRLFSRTQELLPWLPKWRESTKDRNAFGL